MEGLIEGRIVHYVLPNGRSKGEHRPAIIVKVWESHRAQGTVNMQVFTDGENDGLEHHSSVRVPGNDEPIALRKSANTVWGTSVHYSETKEPGTWHWPEKA